MAIFFTSRLKEFIKEENVKSETLLNLTLLRSYILYG